MKRSNRISPHLIFLITSLFLGSGVSLASQLGFEDAVFPELAISGRALALGGAYNAKVDDSAAPFYNPAGLGTVRGFKFHLSNLHIETNMGWMKVATGGKLTDTFTNLPQALRLDRQRSYLNENPDNIHGPSSSISNDCLKGDKFDQLGLVLRLNSHPENFFSTSL